MDNKIVSTERKSRTPIIIAIVIFVLLIIGGAVFGIISVNQKNNEKLNSVISRDDTVMLLPMGDGYVDEETGVEYKRGLRLHFTNSTEAYIESVTMAFVGGEPEYQEFYAEDNGIWEFEINIFGEIRVCCIEENSGQWFDVLLDDKGAFYGVGGTEMDNYVIADKKYNEYIESYFNFKERFDNIDKFKNEFLSAEYPFYQDVPHQAITWNSILEEVFENIDSFDIVPYDYDENGETYEGYRVTISGTYYQNPALDSYTKQYATSQGTYDVFVTSDNNSAVILQNEFESSSESIDKAMYTYLALNVSNYYSGMYY